MQPTAFENAAATALAAIYSQQGVPATFTQSGETPITVTLLVEDRSRDTRDRQATRSKVHTLRGCLRVSEVPTIDKGDTLVIAGESINFRFVPSSLRCDGLEWMFDATGDVTTAVGELGAVPNM